MFFLKFFLKITLLKNIEAVHFLQFIENKIFNSK